MKTSFILIILSILLVYGCINVYVLLRAWQSMEGFGPVRRIVIALVALMPLLFIVQFFIRRSFNNAFVDICWSIGSEWIAAMLYFLIAVLAIDLLRILGWAVGKSPQLLFGDTYQHVKIAVLGIVTFGVLILLIVGRHNAAYPHINTRSIAIDKVVPGRDSLNVVLISDLHLGAIHGHSDLRRWVEMVNRLEPDLILIAGDVVDDSPAPMERKHLGELLEQMKAPLGVYFAQGNHDLYGDFDRLEQYLKAHHIAVLKDTAVLVADAFYVVGRLDRSAGMGNKLNTHRKTVEALVANIDRTKPVILLDHQPYELDKTVLAGVDLQVSGHTHRGQMWPFSLITKRLYELDHGYLQKGHTHFYVSEGLGTWGPRVRIGTRSEIVQLKIKFLAKQ